MAKMLVDCDALTKKFRDMSTDESATVMYKEKDIYRFMARTISSRVSFISPMFDAEMPGHFRTPLEFESTPFPTVGNYFSSLRR